MTVATLQSVNTAWKKFRLGEILTLINGRAYGKSEERTEGTPVLRIQNLNGGERWFYSDLNLPANKYCDNGDLLFAWSATFGPYIWWGSKVIYHYHIWKIECGPLLDKKFAFYLLQHITQRVKSAGRGISMLHMTKSGMEDWEVEIPPLPEQRRIAGILDQAVALRRLRRRSLVRINHLINAAVERSEQRSGSATLPLPKAFWFQEGPGVRNWQFVDEGVKLLNVSNVTKDGRLEPERSKNRVSFAEASGKYAHFLVDAGDLIMPCSGIPIAKDGFLETRAAFAEPEHLPLCMNTSTIRFKALRNDLDLVFLRGWLQTIEFRRQITRLVTGSAQKNFGPSHLKQLSVTLPSEESIKLLGEEMEAIEVNRLEAVKSMAAMDCLFTSLQHRAFRGEL